MEILFWTERPGISASATDRVAAPSSRARQRPYHRLLRPPDALSRRPSAVRQEAGGDACGLGSAACARAGGGAPSPRFSMPARAVRAGKFAYDQFQEGVLVPPPRVTTTRGGAVPRGRRLVRRERVPADQQGARPRAPVPRADGHLQDARRVRADEHHARRDRRASRGVRGADPEPHGAPDRPAARQAVRAHLPRADAHLRVLDLLRGLPRPRPPLPRSALDHGRHGLVPRQGRGLARPDGHSGRRGQQHPPSGAGSDPAVVPHLPIRSRDLRFHRAGIREGGLPQLHLRVPEGPAQRQRGEGRQGSVRHRDRRVQPALQPLPPEEYFRSSSRSGPPRTTARRSASGRRACSPSHRRSLLPASSSRRWRLPPARTSTWWC